MDGIVFCFVLGLGLFLGWILELLRLGLFVTAVRCGWDLKGCGCLNYTPLRYISMYVHPCRQYCMHIYHRPSSSAKSNSCSLYDSIKYSITEHIYLSSSSYQFHPFSTPYGYSVHIFHTAIQTPIHNSTFLRSPHPRPTTHPTGAPTKLQTSKFKLFRKYPSCIK